MSQRVTNIAVPFLINEGPFASIQEWAHLPNAWWLTHAFPRHAVAERRRPDGSNAERPFKSPSGQGCPRRIRTLPLVTPALVRIRYPQGLG